MQASATHAELYNRGIHDMLLLSSSSNIMCNTEICLMDVHMLCYQVYSWRGHFTQMEFVLRWYRHILLNMLKRTGVGWNLSVPPPIHKKHWFNTCIENNSSRNTSIVPKSDQSEDLGKVAVIHFFWPPLLHSYFLPSIGSIGGKLERVFRSFRGRKCRVMQSTLIIEKRL